MALAAEQPAIFSFLSSCQVGNHFPKSGVKIHHWKPPPKFWFSWEVKTHCFQSFVSLALLLGRTNGFLRSGGIKHSKSRVANIWHSRTSHDCWQTLEKHTNAIQALGKLSQINISRLCWYLFGGTIHCCGTNDIPRLGFSVTLMACSIFSAAARGTARIVFLNSIYEDLMLMGLRPPYGLSAPWHAGYRTWNPISTRICEQIQPAPNFHFNSDCPFIGIIFLIQNFSLASQLFLSFCGKGSIFPKITSPSPTAPKKLSLHPGKLTAGS